MKYYITKYALSDGILFEECSESISEGYVHIVGYNNRTRILDSFLKLDVDAFETFEEARRKAETMRNKKIESLKKQLERLEKLRFEIPKEEI